MYRLGTIDDKVMGCVFWLRYSLEDTPRDSGERSHEACNVMFKLLTF